MYIKYIEFTSIIQNCKFQCASPGGMCDWGCAVCQTGAAYNHSGESLVSGRGECAKKPSIETEISQRWTGKKPRTPAETEYICIYDDNNDYIENSTEEQLRKGREMPVILAHKHRKAPPLPLAREHGTPGFLRYTAVCALVPPGRHSWGRHSCPGLWAEKRNQPMACFTSATLTPPSLPTCNPATESYKSLNPRQLFLWGNTCLIITGQLNLSA